MSEFLTQSQLAEKLVQRTGVSPEVAKKFSSVFFTIVKVGLKNSTSFSVYNFGTFKKTWIEDSIGMNPASGEKINIPAHWRIKFIPSASVAKRINRPYAHLKARLATEQELKNPTLTTSVPTVMSESDVVDEDDFDEDFFNNTKEKPSQAENTKNRFWLKLLEIGAAILLLLAFLISIFVKSCSSKTKNKSEKTENVEPQSKEIKENEEVLNPTPEEMFQNSTEFTDETDEELQTQRLFEYYVVKTGSDYHSIAQELYGNRHLWPILYSANKSFNSDPDFVASYANIKIPELPQNLEEKNELLEKSVLEAYNGYLLMCEKESESPKNEKRRRLAVRVLVSGEIVMPGFIQKNQDRILPDYALMAQNIANHQYK